jgi:oligoendopeptidase F
MLILLSLAYADAPQARPEDTWDLSAVYPNVEAWEKALTETEAAAAGLASCRGKLAAELRPCLERRFDVQKAVMRAYVYAMNNSNADTRDGAWMGRAQRAEMLATSFGEDVSFFEPEIIAMGAPAVDKALAGDEALAPFDYYLRGTVQDAPHTLDAAGEALLASMGNVLSAPERTHGLMLNAELPWPKITLSDGKEQTLTPATYTNVRASKVRADRKMVFDSFFGAIAQYKGVLGSELDAVVQGHWMNARARNYPTSVAASIDRDHVPAEVYTTLVAQTNANLPTLHRYLRLRARILGLDDLAYSDLYTPLVALEKSWTVDQANTLLIDATRPLGPEYAAALKAGITGRWTDVYPRPGKMSGAYMDGAAYDVHPFLLLNFTGDYESVSTHAHEWGHGIHSALASKAQPYAKSDYATFIAEIASTFNEALLLQHVLAGVKDPDERLYYLGSALEGLRTTYFRQAQFAEFELAIHQSVEKGEPLTGESLTAKYLEIVRRYHGHDARLAEVPDAYGVEWAYIPHFYYNFYVYQYATSIAASSLLADEVLQKKKGALDRYLTLLKAGGSDDPYVLLKAAGVDLASPAPYDALARRMNAIMDEMETILKKKAAKKGK